MMRLRLGWLALATASLAGASVAPAVTVDDFSVGPVALVGPLVTSSSGLDANHVIGGARQIYLGFLTNATNTLTIHGGLGEAQFATGSGPGLGHLSFVYGAAQPLAANLTAGGHDRIRLRFSGVDSGADDILASFTVRDAANQAANRPLGVGMLALEGLGGVIEFPFADLGVNLANVSGIRFDVADYPVGGTFQLDEIVTAPPPLVGDYNRDGAVDLDDYAEWKKFYGRTVSDLILAADGNGDGRVDAGDYVAWRNNLGAPGGGGVAAISAPEPAFGQLLGCLAVISLIAPLRTAGRQA